MCAHKISLGLAQVTMAAHAAPAALAALPALPALPAPTTLVAQSGRTIAAPTIPPPLPPRSSPSVVIPVPAAAAAPVPADTDLDRIWCTIA